MWRKGPVIRRLGAILLGFGYMVLLIESLHVGVAWWRDELTNPGPLEWLMLGILPVLGWVWFRYLSIFRPGCGKVQCGLPDSQVAKPPPPAKEDF